MNIYLIEWNSQKQPRKFEWFGTQAEMRSRKTELNRLSTHRPFEQIEILRAGKIDFPTDKAGLLEWLNKNVSRPVGEHSE